MSASRRARCSVVVPARDEENVLAACLAFVGGLEPGEAEVVVVANGCTDRTAEVARAVPGVTVLDLPAGDKTAALNAGDAVATAFPRVYLDADVRLDAGAVRRLAEVTGGPLPVVAAPRPRFDVEGRPRVVRAFYDAYQRLPYASEGLVGRGVYALSETGRSRFGAFPPITADDLFVQRLFRPDERVVLTDVAFTVAVPRTLRDLLAVRTRAAFGSRELAGAYPERDFARTTSGTVHALLALARRDPRLWPQVAVYVAVTLEARRRARGSRGGLWHRDLSSRALPAR